MLIVVLVLVLLGVVRGPDPECGIAVARVEVVVLDGSLAPAQLPLVLLGAGPSGFPGLGVLVGAAEVVGFLPDCELCGAGMCGGGG